MEEEGEKAEARVTLQVLCELLERYKDIRIDERSEQVALGVDLHFPFYSTNLSVPIWVLKTHPPKQFLLLQDNLSLSSGFT